MTNKELADLQMPNAILDRAKQWLLPFEETGDLKMLEFSHKPVMPNECMEGLALKDGGIYFDGTVGGGGHSYEILKRTSPSGKLIATDLDDQAIAAAKMRLAPFWGRFEIYKSLIDTIKYKKNDATFKIDIWILK